MHGLFHPRYLENGPLEPGYSDSNLTRLILSSVNKTNLISLRSDSLVKEVLNYNLGANGIILMQMPLFLNNYLFESFLFSY